MNELVIKLGGIKTARTQTAGRAVQEEELGLALFAGKGLK